MHKVKKFCLQAYGTNKWLVFFTLTHIWIIVHEIVKKNSNFEFCSFTNHRRCNLHSGLILQLAKHTNTWNRSGAAGQDGLGQVSRTQGQARSVEIPAAAVQRGHKRLSEAVRSDVRDQAGKSRAHLGRRDQGSGVEDGSWNQERVSWDNFSLFLFYSSLKIINILKKSAFTFFFFYHLTTIVTLSTLNNFEKLHIFYCTFEVRYTH